MALKVGGTEVITNARQLSNIASVDATTVAALGTAGVGGGGGQFDAVASGAISNGALVSLNSDGTVSTTSALMGAEQEIDGDSIDEITTAYDTNSNKVVVFYYSNTSSRAKAAVGTVSGTSISFGTPVVVSANNLTKLGATFDSNSNKVIFVAKDGNNGTSFVGTVSGTSISFGGPYNFTSSGTTSFPFVTFDSNSNKVVICYRFHDGSAFTGRCRVGTVSGTSMSFGTEVQFQNNNVVTDGITFDSNSNKVVILYKHNDDSSKGKCIVGTVSGTSISFGTAVAFTAANSRPQTLTFDSNSNKIVIAYSDATNATYLAAVVGTVSGTSISFGSKVAIASDTFTDPAMVFETQNNQVVLAYTDGNSTDVGRIVAGNVSGTSITFDNPIEYNSRVSSSSMAFDPDTNQIALSFDPINNSNKGTTKMIVPKGLASFFKWIGFASSAISDTATGTINVLGGINESQSSLEVGSTYYLTSDATLTTTVTSGREVGKALSATKLLITQGSVS